MEFRWTVTHDLSSFNDLAKNVFEAKRRLGYNLWRIGESFRKDMVSDVYNSVEKYSGKLGNAISVIRKRYGDSLEVGLLFDQDLAPHVNTHIRFPGERGSITIVPRKGGGRKYLAVPFGGRASPYYGKSPSERGEAFWVWTGKKGRKRLYLYPVGVRPGSKGKNTGPPAYVLKSSVTIKRRVQLGTSFMKFQNAVEREITSMTGSV